MHRKPSACPSCNVIGRLHKSHSKNFFERILNHSYVWGTYRCHSCGWRGILLRRSKLNFSFMGLLKTLLLFLVVFYIVVYIVKNYTK